MATDPTAAAPTSAHGKSEYPPAHTAEHLLNQTMVRMFGCERSAQAHIERKKSKMNFTLAAPPTPGQVAEIEQRVGEQIALCLPVTMSFVARADVPPSVSLSRLPHEADGAPLRLVHIGDYDVCACIGAHVEHTGEIGRFRITSTSWTPSADGQGGSFRIVFRLEGADPRY